MEHDLEECVKRLRLEPGDVLILRTKRLTRDAEERIRRTMAGAFPDHKCVVLEDITLEVTRATP